MGASSDPCCSSVKYTLPRPWYERVQSIAGTPSVSGGASSRPSVRERCERASVAADSAVALRFVGTRSPSAEEGTTVRVGLEVVGRDVAADAVDGFAVVVVVDVVVVAAAFGVVAHAARVEQDTKLRLCIRYATGADLEHEAARSADTPLRTVMTVN